MKPPVIIYLSPFDILRPRTNQVSDVRFCEGFAQNDCEVHLLVPTTERKDNISRSDVPAFYGLKTLFSIHYLPTNFRGEPGGKLSLLKTSGFALLAVLKLTRNRNAQKFVIISRKNFLLLPLILLKKLGILKIPVQIVPWLHDLKLKPNDQFVYKNADALLATNTSILQDLKKVVDLKGKPSEFTLNPITQAQADEFLTKQDARKICGLENLNKPLIVYTGKIGIHYNRELMHLLEAARKLPGCQFLFTGGNTQAVSLWKQKCSELEIKNIEFTGYLPDYSRIRNYQYAADILVSYYTQQGHDPRYNLPNKICEYMLTGNAVISPDYPATREILNDSNCFFTRPENPAALAATIQFVLDHPEIAREKGAEARKQVADITFRNVAKKLISFFNHIHEK